MGLCGRMMYPKPQKPRRDARHMARVAELPCVICGRHPVQVHHVIHDRHAQRRAADTETIPLCPDHHRELHAGSATWRDRYGPDHGFLPRVARLLEG
jgi:hypothetical protein